MVCFHDVRKITPSTSIIVTERPTADTSAIVETSIVPLCQNRRHDTEGRQ